MKSERLLIDRRLFAVSAAAAIIGGCASAPRADPQLTMLEDECGGRIGIAAFNKSSSIRALHRADERFAMCSTFKWALAAIFLEDVDAGRRSLSELVPITDADLVPYAPAVEKALSRGSMTTAELLEAAVGLSDNAAANILLRFIGGPEGFTNRIRASGDDVTRLDRWEPDLNENRAGDVRDTTSPMAMANLLQRFLWSGALTNRSNALIASWMIESPTGRNRLRAGFPSDWIVGDKTGTSINGAVNAVGFATPPGNETIFFAAYIDANAISVAKANDIHRRIGAHIARVFS